MKFSAMGGIFRRHAVLENNCLISRTARVLDPDDSFLS